VEDWIVEEAFVENVGNTYVDQGGERVTLADRSFDWEIVSGTIKRFEAA